MKGIPSLLRLEEHRAMSRITLSGRVLDLGGDKNSNYVTYFKGTFTTTTVNISEKSKPDIVHDLEHPIPLADASYDGALLINVLEHVFNYRQLLQESVRILRPGGTVVIVVPFLFPIHPSPYDFHRFTEMALRRECESAGLEHIEVWPLGSGVFAARYLMLDRLLPKPLRALNFYTFRYVVMLADTCVVRVVRMLGKKYVPGDYALGFCVHATKRS